MFQCFIYIFKTREFFLNNTLFMVYAFNYNHDLIIKQYLKMRDVKEKKINSKIYHLFFYVICEEINLSHS